MDEQEYKLALDDQVGKFLDVRHKHTYFLVTAAIVVLAFVVNFAAANKLLSDLSPLALVLIAIGALSSLSVAGFALWSLSLDNTSHSLHLKYRHLSKNWNRHSDLLSSYFIREYNFEVVIARYDFC